MVQQAYTADADFTYHGTVVALHCHTEAALTWVNENVEADPWQWVGEATIVLEWRYADRLLEAIQEYGLDVSTSDGAECAVRSA